MCQQPVAIDSPELPFNIRLVYITRYIRKICNTEKEKIRQTTINLCKKKTNGNVVNEDAKYRKYLVNWVLGQLGDLAMFY